jgi:hypothetical protein
MRSIALRLGIIGLIAGGAFVLRPFLSGNAGNLAVGDCFDPPAVSGETVEDVQHHPCTDAHGGEVIFVGEYEPASETYPSDDEFVTFVGNQCVSAFNSYTGLDYLQATDLDFHVFTPTREGWGNGDRTMICYAVRVDGTTFNQSIKAAQ